MMITGTLIEIKTGQPAKWHEVQAAAYAKLIEKNWDKNIGRLISDNPYFARVPIWSEDKKKIIGYKYEHTKAKRLFSVTQVCTLGGWQYADKTAANEGTWIHGAINLIDQGKFTYTATDLNPVLWMKTEAYRKFTKDYPQFSVPGITERPLCGKIGNKGTYVAGTFDKYIPAPWNLEIFLLYLRGNGDYELAPVETKKINYYISKFRHALEWLEFIK